MTILRSLLVLALLPGLSGSLFAEGPTGERPNILFAIADDWSHGHSSVDGAKWIKTPGFDRVANSGIRFTNAFTNNAKCCPSRSILLTGRHSWQLEDAANHICYFPAKFKVATEALAGNGYFTGHTGKGWGPGVAKDAQGKDRLMTGPGYNRRKAKPPFGSISNNDYAANFEDFLSEAPKEKPWFFWYGATEPHRGYQYGAGVAKGKKLSDIDRVPGFWPDNQTTRNDMLDYAVEIEHFDSHLERMLAFLEQRGELENTLVVVTSDHGMPFPRCKGQAYNYSNHVPLAVMWPKGLKNPGRVVSDYVSFIDIAPTFLELVGIKWETSGMSESPGRSLSDILFSEQSGQVNPQRNHVLIGKERHDIGRPNDAGYPVRGIIKENFLYLRNYEPDRWPACNPETGYLNCDGSPTKTLVLKGRTQNDQKKFWDLCFGKRPAEELYDLATDPECLQNLLDPKSAPNDAEMKEKVRLQRFLLVKAMEGNLEEQKDPRIVGHGEIFDKYPYANPGQRNFYERYMKGEKLNAGWVNPTDFEKSPLD